VDSAKLGDIADDRIRGGVLEFAANHVIVASVVMQSEISCARHNLRGRMNALKLCISALTVVDTPDEAIQFLDHILKSTENLEASLDVFIAAAERDAQAEPLKDLEPHAADLRKTRSG
jgi:hypothetical protein